VVAVVVRLLACDGEAYLVRDPCGAAVPCRPALLLDPTCTVTLVHESRDIQQGADMTQRIPNSFSMSDWSLATKSLPPRDPNDDDDDDDDEDEDEDEDERDDDREPAVIREPDEDE
jgi:hypothetical protein